MAKSDTPLLDELEKGKWPSFVKDMKQAAQKNPMARDLIQQLELSYKDRIGHWKHGGIVGVKGYGAGVIGRYSDRPDLFPNVQAFHTMRVNHPTGWFYKTDTLRKLCDIWDKHGSGLTNMHGSTGDAILLGTTTNHLQACFDDLSSPVLTLADPVLPCARPAPASGQHAANGPVSTASTFATTSR
jgi:sulfite reductase alpha subunit